jgi:hypothetical protein
VRRERTVIFAKNKAPLRPNCYRRQPGEHERAKRRNPESRAFRFAWQAESVRNDGERPSRFRFFGISQVFWIFPEDTIRETGDFLVAAMAVLHEGPTFSEIEALFAVE